jgi:SsrA-binding protein
MISSDAFQREEKLVASNRKARHDFAIVFTLEAGIALTGTEVKSLRQGKCSLVDAYAAFKNKNDDTFVLYNCHINEYTHGNIQNHQPKRDRILLINANEIKKLRNLTQEKGMTIVPLRIYFSGQFAKVELGVAKPKKKYDKREALKEREQKRETQRSYKM